MRLFRANKKKAGLKKIEIYAHPDDVPEFKRLEREKQEMRLIKPSDD